MAAKKNKKAARKAAVSQSAGAAAKDNAMPGNAELRALNDALSQANSRLRHEVDELSAANRELTSLMAATNSVAVVVDTQQRISRFTPSAARAFNLLARDVGQPLRDFASRFGDDDACDDVEHVIETLVPIETEIRATQDHWYLRRMLPYRAADGRIGGVVVTFIDITARIAAEAEVRALNAELEQKVAQRTAELEASEQRIRAVVDAAIDAIITIDTSGRISTFNKGAETIFGYTTDEAIGRNISMLMGAPYRDKHDSYLKRYLDTGEARVIGRERNFRGRRKDGTEFPMQLTVSEVDHMGLFTGIVRDTTEQHALQEEIVRTASFEQRRIARELHDSTQQELTGLGLLARNLADSLNAPQLAEHHELAAKIADGITAANQHVRRLAKGLLPVPIDAEGLMMALAELANHAERDYGIRCEFVCPSPVPVANDSAAVQLYRIVQEALTNALKHSGASAVTIRLSHSDGMATVTVRDNGVGIDTQPDTTSGLGLRIMKHRCEIVGGTISIRRRKSGGTVVKCQVPVTGST